MRRIIFRPFLNFHEPFVPLYRKTVPQCQFRSKSHLPQSEVSATQKHTNPHDLFQQFFKENQPKTEDQKQFFKKLYPQKVQEAYDPFKILEINKNATVEQTKDAYRKLAIKYHPKNNTLPEASQKFQEISKAYETIIQTKKSQDFEDLRINNFLQEFDKQIDEFIKLNQSSAPKQTTKVQHPSSNETNYGHLYSQASHYETINGKPTQYVTEKVYKKDGAYTNIRKEEKLKDDGRIEITQTIDNGKEITKKIYIHDKDTKRINYK